MDMHNRIDHRPLRKNGEMKRYLLRRLQTGGTLKHIPPAVYRNEVLRSNVPERHTARGDQKLILSRESKTQVPSRRADQTAVVT
jgi:hypothetical protein